MRKYIFSICICCFISLPCFAQGDRNPLTPKLKGNVRMVEEICYGYHDGYYGLQFVEEEAGTYIITSHTQTYYDTQGRMLEIYYIYDEDKEAGYEKERFLETSFEYQESKKDPIRRIEYNPDGSILSIEVCKKYRRNYRKYITYNIEDEDDDIEEYEDDEIARTDVIRWNKKQIKRTITDELEQRKVTYQHINGIISQIHFTNDKYNYSSITEFINNEQGDPVEEIRYEGSDRRKLRSCFCTYEYDTTGNWTKQTYTIEGNDYVEGYVERTITYY